MNGIVYNNAPVVELVDTQDLKAKVVKIKKPLKA